MIQKKLKRGYTTGVHTSFAFKGALETFLATSLLCLSKTNKMENDDLDVTKGCEIIVTITKNKDDLILNKTVHKPYILKNKDSKLELYAGMGVGVVTKDGLKPPKNYPAINPKPLEVLESIFSNFKINDKILFCTVEVTNGEKLAKQTANNKVGVVAGISILGTTGFVKPISSIAYIDSINEELNFAKANKYDTIIFTLGNTAFKEATAVYSNDNKTYIIEIGNFIYDGIQLAVDKEFSHIILMLGIGKAVKVSQEFKNTHNRFGDIDFQKIQEMVSIDIEDVVTIKRVCELLGEQSSQFKQQINIVAQKQLKIWFKKDIEVKIC